jgi:hypothetical protein
MLITSVSLPVICCDNGSGVGPCTLVPGLVPHPDSKGSALSTGARVGLGVGLFGGLGLLVILITLFLNSRNNKKVSGRVDIDA